MYLGFDDMNISTSSAWQARDAEIVKAKNDLTTKYE